MEKQKAELGGLQQILHGGDYNPDQWLHYPEILEEDICLMKKAHVNCVSLGIFSWTGLEPEEGRYEFSWLESIIQNLYENGIYTNLATPTGALPLWLTAKYEEVMQMNEFGVRNLPGNRHNFCPSSPVMREKMRQLNSRLSERLGKHSGVIAWHISNEYGGNGRDASCHCTYCQEAFRNWLKERYTTLDALNEKWWTKFWSHTYTDWQQIQSPSARGENVLHGLNLDWKRFVSNQLLDFCKDEIQEVRRYSKQPVTTNMMGFFKPLNYFEWAKELDIISWDCYPYWHSEADEIGVAVEAAATHSLMRSLKKKPFLLMESTPSLINWRPLNILKRPGMHTLSSLQAVAHGSNSVQYFQWRKSRGSCEKFHGAVLDHKNGENTRVFRDVEDVGKRLKDMSGGICKSCNQAEVAFLFDWENWWALEDAWAVENKQNYLKELLLYYRPIWEMGIDVDIVDMEQPINEYKIIIAPLNYMYRSGYAEKVRSFVKNGGFYVTTYWSGEVDENDLCFLQEHPLQDVLGIRTEEIDAQGQHMENMIKYENTTYCVEGLCSLVHVLTAKVLAAYQRDFYAGYPALTENKFENGKAYYIASQNEPLFLKAMYKKVLEQAGVSSSFQGKLPDGVTVSERIKGDCIEVTHKAESIWFLQNFNKECAKVEIRDKYRNLETGEALPQVLEMLPFACIIVEKMMD